MSNIVTHERSKLWYIASFLFGILGGIISYLIIRKDDPVKAKRCLIIGVVATAGSAVVNIIVFGI